MDSRRYVTGANEHSAHFWLGGLSTALAVAPKHPEVAREAFNAYLRSPVPDPQERETIDRLRRNPR